MSKTDEKFYDRADEHINLSNDQLNNATKGEVSASMMYGVSRFNAWISATGWNSSTEMKNAKEETIKYFTIECEKMLRENLTDYIENFDRYMK
ncbi:DUF3144 domain-containing protein [Aquimarina sp. AU119]|uniref:DUF3144 domain-containing protein n=1 Tax=Aquimarina sp. AU119 TaxID=2108528 RepID=UPI000D6945C2|nr:DUF3144 domain-containing protein [Aquimarina sp. AU119]